MKEQVAERLKKTLIEFLKELNYDYEKTDLAVVFKDFNSILFIRLLLYIENEFNIEFDDEDLDETVFQSFDDMVNKICNLMEEE